MPALQFFLGRRRRRGTPPVLPADLPTAIRLHLLADVALAAALKGGVWWVEAPPAKGRPGGGWPFAVFFFPMDIPQDISTQKDVLHIGTLQLSIFARNEDKARRIADRAERLLTDSYLRFVGGRITYIRPGNPASFSRPEIGPGGGVIWQAIRQIHVEWNTHY